jgi:hypothetical protein
MQHVFKEFVVGDNLGREMEAKYVAERKWNVTNG